VDRDGEVINTRYIRRVLEFIAIEQLLPWSDFIKQHCSGLTDTETITSTNKPALEIKK
jgi:hypothetical protein